MMPTGWKWVKLGSFLVGMVGVISGVHALGIHWSSVTPERIRAFITSCGVWAWLVYVLVYAQPVVPLPMSVMAMAAGLSFGLKAGFVMAILAGTIRGCGQFLLARTFGREAVETLFRGRLARLYQQIGDDGGFQTVLWLRLVPNVPADVQNFCLGLSRVSFGAFALASFLGLMPAVWLWVYVGHTLVDASQLWRIFAVLMGLALLWYLHRRLQRRHGHPLS